MKNFIFAFLAILSLNTVEVFADDTKNNIESESNVTIGQYTSVSLRDLPEVVQDILAMDYTGYSVSSADVKSLNKENIIFRVTLSDQENLEKIVLLSDKGEVLD